MHKSFTFAALVSTSSAIVTKSGTGKLPSLGWNSWNMYGCDITEDKFLSAAEEFVNLGLKDAGYEYINIDDCWSVKGDRKDGHIVVDTNKFPDGISGLADKIHDMGLKIGIYSSAGTETCAGYPASLFNEDTDAADWASWGIDYLKYDNCNIPDDWRDQYTACDFDWQPVNSKGECSKDTTPNLAPPGYDWRTSKSFERFTRMKDALAKQDHEIVLSMCIWGTGDVFSWGNDTGISWRMSNDINPSWDRVKNILNQNTMHLDSIGFWGHNDADMLELGNGLTQQESRSHFAFWAAMKSPLLIGTNLTALDAGSVDILKNKYLLAFNQDDTYGGPAKPYKWGTNPDGTFDPAHPAEFWTGPSKNGNLVLMLNTQDDSQKKSAVWSEVFGSDAAGSYQVTDVWSGKDLGCLSSFDSDVEAHDTAAILVGSSC